MIHSWLGNDDDDDDSHLLSRGRVRTRQSGFGLAMGKDTDM